ncbi:MAG: hypothetical protein KC636_32575 [Myxococcales bacterium]|nr:hypothetical protein [Myxococcales bacterium]
MRRLAARSSGDGGQYGRWLLRFFGLPPRLLRWAAWLGQYHSRFADLPTGLRLEQLRRWDREPIRSSPAAAWIDVGMASVLHRRGELEACLERLARARRSVARAGADARMEVLLLGARIDTDRGALDEAARALAEVEGLLAAPTLADVDRLAYQARLVGQRAYHHLHSAPPEPARALAMFDALPSTTGEPFVDFRREEGRARCLHRLGRAEEALAAARLAARHAGDGGLVRCRVMALELAARLAAPDEAEALRVRASRLAARLEDEDLLRRTAPS